MSSNQLDKPIINTTPVANQGVNVYPNNSDFNRFVLSKGIQVYHDRVLMCPCRRKEDRSPLSDCRNCGGSGFVYLNRELTTMVVQSINLDTKFKDWTEEKMGTVKITTLEQTQLSFMDRITLINASAVHNQVIFPQVYFNQLKARLLYSAIEVLQVFAFSKSNSELILLYPNSDWTVNENIITFDDRYLKWENFTISVQYCYRPQFYIRDLTRDVSILRSEDKVNNEESLFPICAIGKRAHYVLDEQNFSDSYLLDNLTPNNMCSTNTPYSTINTPIFTYVNVVDQDTLELHWALQSAPEGGVVVIEKSTDRNTFVRIASVEPPVDSFSDEDVEVNIQYYYRIAYYVNGQQSNWSDIIGIQIAA